MNDALVAVHYQNDICHPDGLIPFSLNRRTPEAEAFLAASLAALESARLQGWTIAHVHIGFADDYSDLPRHPPLFQKVARFGAVKRGSWGAAPYAGFEPREGEIAVSRNVNSGFRNTDLDRRLRGFGVGRLNFMGMATQFAVEHTARDAADLGYAVRILRDCCASADAEAHKATLRVLAMLGEIVDSASVLPRTALA
jgi:nicotinamidase-related amidase